MLWTAVVLIAVGLVNCQSNTEGGGVEGEPDPRIVALAWDCSADHRPHPTDPRKFQQSAGGFGEGAPIFENTCPTPLQVFGQNPDGRCFCLYTPELRALLEQDCQIRVGPGYPEDEYDLLIPNLVVGTIEELYMRKSCNEVLPANIQSYYDGLNINPLFFNTVNCSCDWTPAALAAPPPPVGEGDRCERLVDQDFNTPRIGSDLVGNWLDVFPFFFQNNVTNVGGGAAFGPNQIIAAASWRLMDTDFVELNLVARFRASGSGGDQIIFSNECRDREGSSGGFVTLLYNPSGNRYTVSFFGSGPVSCSAGGGGDQNVQLRYSRTMLSLQVGTSNCDISSINPIVSPENEGRLKFNNRCPMQLGGRVYTDVFAPDYGQPDSSGSTLNGVYFTFMALRNCDNPPVGLVSRISGLGQ